jgi:predicted ribosome quality control (RQC) complex YloA/Tae2 family protein
MPKTRFTSLDLRRAILDLQVQEIVGMRLSNLYDLNRKTYLLKFAKADCKLYVVIESGIRVHSTKYSRERNEVPSIFSMKLRKYIRTKRVEKIEQYGMDRVFDMTFGSGEATYHLIVELYAAGNIILTDKDYNILCLLRSYTVGETTVALGSVYPKEMVREIVAPTNESLKLLFTKNSEKSIKNAISQDLEGFEPAVVEHCIFAAGLNSKEKASSVKDEQISNLRNSFQEIIKYMESVAPHPGWIVSNKIIKKEDQSELIIYDQFLPFLFHQFENALLSEYTSFNEAADEYFSKLESQKIETQQIDRETTVDRKLEKVRQDHADRIKGLETQEQQFNQFASLIEQNIDAIDEVIAIMRKIRSEHVDWVELAQQIKNEKENGNPIALMIHKLKLIDNKVSVLLSDTFMAEDEDNYDKAAEVIDIDIGLSAYANARFYYDRKKQAIEKNEKTRAASAAALQSAEIKAKASMHDVKKLKSVTALRKPFWFEKFHWFITSDNIIVIGGRDISQNELLYKKYLQKGDMYFHADIHGASSVIVKNPSGESLPLNTIWQAGSFALCHSSAWKNKVMSDTFYVTDSQVSKTAPTGEYVSSGGFIIRGKKNYCTQNQLVMGFGIIFKVADESIINHIDERKPKIIEMVADPNDNKGWQPKKKKENKIKEDDEEEEEDEVDNEDSDDIDEDLLAQSNIVNLLSTSTISESKEEKEVAEEEADQVGVIKSKKTVNHAKHQQPQKKKRTT